MKRQTLRKTKLVKRSMTFAALVMTLFAAAAQAQTTATVDSQWISGTVVAMNGSTLTLKAEHPVQFEDASGTAQVVRQGAKVRITAVTQFQTTAAVSTAPSRDKAIPTILVTANAGFQRALAHVHVGSHVSFRGSLSGGSMALTQFTVSSRATATLRPQSHDIRDADNSWVNPACP